MLRETISPFLPPMLKMSEISPFQPPFPFPIYRSIPENPVKLVFSVPVENMPDNLFSPTQK